MFGLEMDFNVITTIKEVAKIRIGNNIVIHYADSEERLKEFLNMSLVDFLVVNLKELNLVDGFEGKVILKGEPDFQSFNAKRFYLSEKNFLLNAENLLKSHFKLKKLKAENQYLINTLEKVEAEYKNHLEIKKEKEKNEINFLSLINHEFKTPLNVILGLTNLMKATPLNSKQNEYMIKMDKAANMLFSTLDEILSFEVVSLEGVATNDRIDLLRMLDDLILVFKHFSDEKNIKLSYSIDPMIQNNLIGDRRKLEIILHQLVSNAIKFTEKGRVDIIITTEHTKDEVSRLHFLVKDTGCGFDLKIRDRIAEPFYQEDSMLSRKYGGLGLGLSIVKKALERFNAVLEIDSQIGVGSQFGFSINFTIGGKDFAERTIQFDKVKILLVDDNELNRLITKEILSNKGAEVHTASDGFEAVDKSEREIYDLILMDIMMPKMDGYMATELIRDKGIKSPIIALTASEIDVVYEKMKESGMDDYIEKRLPIETYLNKLAKYIDKDKISYQIKEEGPKIMDAFQKREALFDTERAVKRFNGNMKILYKVMDNLIVEYEQVDLEFEKQLNANNIEELVRMIHSIRGLAANLEVINVRDLAAELEKEIIYGKIDESKIWHFVDELKAFIEEVRPLRDELKKQLEDYAVALDETVGKETCIDHALLERLMKALEVRDMREVRDTMEKIRKTYERTELQFVEKLNELIGSYRFEEAIQGILIFMKR